MSESTQMQDVLARITNESSQVTTTTKVSMIKQRNIVKPQKICPKNIKKTTIVGNDNECDFDGEWETVSSCLDSIFSNSNQTNFESSFRCLEKLCKKTENLVLINEKLKSSLTNFVDEMFVKELKERFDLERLSNIWIDLKRIVLLISSMFVIYEKKILSPLTIKDVVFEIVRNKIHENDDIINNVCYGISNFFYSQRKAMIEKDEDYLIKFDLIKEYKEILIVFDIQNTYMNVSSENVERFYSEFKLDDKDINFLKSIKEVLRKEKEILNDLSEELQNNRFMIIFNKLYIDQLLKSIDMYLNQIYEEDNYIENMQLLSNLVSITKNKDLINLLIEK